MEIVSSILILCVILIIAYFILGPLVGLGYKSSSRDDKSIDFIQAKKRQDLESFGIACLDGVGFIALIILFSKMSDMGYQKFGAIIGGGLLAGLLFLPSVTRMAVSICAIIVLIPQTEVVGMSVVLLSFFIFILVRVFLIRRFGMR